MKRAKEKAKPQQKSAAFLETDKAALRQGLKKLLNSAWKDPAALEHLGEVIRWSLLVFMKASRKAPIQVPITERAEYELRIWKNFSSLLSTTVDDLNQMAEGRQDLFRWIAGPMIAWPINASFHHDLQIQNEFLMRNLGLGSHAPLKVTFPKGQKRQWSFIAPSHAANLDATPSANHLALLLYRQVEIAQLNGKIWGDEMPSLWQEAAELDSFSESNWSEWFKIAWKFLLVETDNAPERDPRFQPLGEYRRSASVRKGAQKKDTERTADANVRDGIKTRLKKSFKTIAGPGLPSRHR